MIWRRRPDVSVSLVADAKTKPLRIQRCCATCRLWLSPRRAATPCECCCGPAGACVISPKSWGRRGTRFALRLLAICYAGWTTACRQTARHGKAVTTSIATHNFVTSTRKRSTSSARLNRSSRSTLSARNWSVIQEQWSRVQPQGFIYGQLLRSSSPVTPAPVSHDGSPPIAVHLVAVPRLSAWGACGHEHLQQGM